MNGRSRTDPARTTAGARVGRIRHTPTGTAAGYACTRRFGDEAACDTRLETSIYLAPEACGQGLGRALCARIGF
jgi:L-amino acid N-acyltransferase YncA